MPPKSPSFWQEDTIISRLLSPLSCLYLLAHKLKTKLTKPYTSTLPVLCVGGVVAGGSGKTPVVHALLKIIKKQELFVNPVVLTRGYGGKLKGPTAVDPKFHTVIDVGDEALLHANHTTTIVSKDRVSGAKLAEAMGADLIILDDGLQNPSLVKTLSLLVIDAAQGFGNKRLLPAGPLREPLEDALNKCHAIIQLNGQTSFNKPTINANIAITSKHDKSKTYVGFAGLGHPQKFKNTLEQNGFTLSGFSSFPDHHPYSNQDIEALITKAKDATLITTSKDFVRIPQQFQDQIEVLEIELSFENPDAITNLLKRIIP